MADNVPPELWFIIFNQPSLSGFKGILRMVCRQWRDILDELKVKSETRHIEMVKTISLVKFGLGLPKPYPWDSSICANAVEGGHLETLKWVRAQDPPCPWGSLTCSYAVMGGHLETLKWLRKEDPPCPWDFWTCSYAAMGGHLETLEWLRENGCPPSAI